MFCASSHSAVPTNVTGTISLSRRRLSMIRASSRPEAVRRNLQRVGHVLRFIVVHGFQTMI